MQPVVPQDIPKHWEWVERGLVEIIRKTGEKWTPVHVLQALNEGRAGLYVTDDGFSVLQKLREDWTGEQYIYVWALWFKPRAAKRIRGALVDWLDDLTRRSGLRKWKFGSPRLGWGALDECVIETVIYRRVIDGD